MSVMNTVAELMALAARTAPKAGGGDYVVTAIVEGEHLQRLADELVNYTRTTGRKNFDRDGENVRVSEAVVLIGLKNAAVMNLDCGACGHPTCITPNTSDGPEFSGPQCALRLLDMGVALGSAVKVASMLNVDNRIMYHLGVIARKLGYLDADFIMGIPLAATAKSPYFDRK
jgi:uncharacterized ferredoxin-like protein